MRPRDGRRAPFCTHAATNGKEGVDALLRGEVQQRQTGAPNREMKIPVLQLGDFVQDRDLRRTWGIGQQKKGDTQFGKQQGHRGPDTGTDAGNICSPPRGTQCPPFTAREDVVTNTPTTTKAVRVGEGDSGGY